MKSLNRVTLIGNVGNVDLKYTEKGTAYLNISLATTTSYKDSREQWQEKTEWHRTVFWGKRAESIVRYIQKGSKLYIEGRLETKKWDNNGTDAYTTSINVSDIVLLGGNNKSENSTNNQPQQTNNEDIPF